MDPRTTMSLHRCGIQTFSIHIHVNRKRKFEEEKKSLFQIFQSHLLTFSTMYIHVCI